MLVKKLNGKIYGAHLSATEKKAMKMEIQRQLAEYEQKHAVEMDALILWILHENYGFGEKRLRMFHDNFMQSIKELTERYELDDSDNIWLCTKKLKDYGIDIYEWSN